jgi:hypothetical protein
MQSYVPPSEKAAAAAAKADGTSAGELLAEP